MDDETIETAGTIGFIAFGVLYVVMGLTATSTVIGGGDTSQQGAIRQIAELPFGPVLLVALAAGLGGYALLRGVHVVTNPSDEDGVHGAALRVGYAARAVFYGALAVYTMAVLTSVGGSGGGGGTKRLTQQVLELPGGALLVGIAAAIALLVAAVQVKEVVTKEFLEDIGDAEGRTRSVLMGLGGFGMVARAVLFGTIGVLLVQAALTSDPSKAGGVDQAVAELSQTGPGSVALPVVGLGLIAFGLFNIAIARFGKTRQAD